MILPYEWRRKRNRLLLPVGLIGLAVLAWHNVRLWRHEHQRAGDLQAEQSIMPRLTHMPRVSALVAAWNEREHIDAHIESFLALSYPDIELILCAGGRDDTLERARRYAQPRVIVLEQQPGEGKQRALARCLEYASGEIIYLTDADCLYQDEALIRLLAPLVEEGEGAATGSSRPLPQQMGRVLPVYLWSRDVAAGVHSGVYSEGLLGRNAAVTRSALQRSGGLGFVARTGTDYHLARRLIRSGIAIRHVWYSVVSTEYPETLRAYQRRQSRWLRNLLLYGDHYGARRDVWLTAKTIAIGALMTLAPLMAPVLGGSVLAPWALLVAHAAAAKLRGMLVTAQLFQVPISRRLAVALIPLTIIDFGIWAWPLIDMLSEKRRTKW